MKPTTREERIFTLLQDIFPTIVELVTLNRDARVTQRIITMHRLDIASATDRPEAQITECPYPNGRIAWQRVEVLSRDELIVKDNVIVVVTGWDIPVGDIDPKDWEQPTADEPSPETKPGASEQPVTPEA